MVDHGPSIDLASAMRVLVKRTNDPSVTSGLPALMGPIRQRLHHRLVARATQGFFTHNPVLHSVAWPATGLGREVNASAADLLHLHWLGNSTLSIEEIGRLSKPVVWTLHDQWAFCGAEHYVTPPPAVDERFVEGYLATNRPSHESGPDLNRRTWERKRLAWRQPLRIVCPSHWLADCARRSALMRHWPVTMIPYPIDLRVWAPCEQAQARQLLQLPPDRPLVLFGAIGGTGDPRKGADLLLEALGSFKESASGTALDRLELVVFGQGRPADPPDLGFPVHYSGHLHDDISLRLLYAAADVFVIPSRQDNLPNTGLEAHACGTPVVAFRTGGLVDVIDDRVTGALAEPFDPASLAAAIAWVLEDPKRRRQLGAAARQRAERLWNPERVAGLYAEVYRQAVSMAK
jgi:glycosyltransferase involved in cell wall biosynthesis